MTYSTILYEADDRVARITFNRPKKMNALSLKLCGEVQDAMATAERDPEVRVIVITGAGGRAFSAGYDLDDPDNEVKFGEPRLLEHYDRRNSKDFQFNYSPFRCTKPVIAMIDGYCLAGGLEFATLCDLRYCSEDSRFQVSETRFASGVLTMAMPWVIGQRCRELIYTGDMFDAQEAYRLGLVNRVFPKDRLDEEVTRIAKRMSRIAMPTLVWSKRALNHSLQVAGFDSALRYGAEANLIMENSQSEFKRFGELIVSDGLEAALKWRNGIFEPFESKAAKLNSTAEKPSRAE
ncbi:enoyl-CoA hydratase/isomerase family protein [Bradyrhizobium sp. CCBAU 53421]|uniref:enoyl-CoA hydratase/isomerase family protein n=1 Tax=Bradyrhizobium sp. CCBAU 53421 TaxID=1325120 RepID=UPI00188A8968|nr:enoyl-CoA hydratase/isomerase family protein [Bradyrhizobium sp. CCBAU 53421]QOZ36406.1 enoyl-CoA hydratase/isomerase family protein [Bradyrhizobium sp. CCBAU 53421]